MGLEQNQIALDLLISYDERCKKILSEIDIGYLGRPMPDRCSDVVALVHRLRKQIDNLPNAIDFVNKFANSGLARKLDRTKKWADELMAKLKTRNRELEDAKKNYDMVTAYASEVASSNKLLKDDLNELAITSANAVNKLMIECDVVGKALSNAVIDLKYLHSDYDLTIPAFHQERPTEDHFYEYIDNARKQMEAK